MCNPSFHYVAQILKHINDI